ncbi:MAG: outer membrane lipoprotein-sorting protein [Candidatus Binatia bacterium]
MNRQRIPTGTVALSLVHATLLVLAWSASAADVPTPAQAAVPAATKAPIETPTSSEFEKSLPAEATLAGREIYDRFLKNRNKLRSAFQYGRIESKDPGGRPQEVRFWLHAKDYRDADEKSVGDVYGKTLIKLIGPTEMRHFGYLYVHHDKADDEQFMYSPQRRRSHRVSLKGQNIASTDFSFDDFLVSAHDLEDADYTRLPDAVVDGVSCYVVEARLKPEARSVYSRTISYLEREHYVPVRTLYWDDAGVETKRLTSPHASIRNFDGVWIATIATMTDLLEETSSTYHLEKLEPNVELDDSDFSISSLQYAP